MTNRAHVMVGKHDNVAKALEPIVEELTGKEQHPLVQHCITTDYNQQRCPLPEHLCPYQQDKGDGVYCRRYS
jgi:hypothetical protein